MANVFKNPQMSDVWVHLKPETTTVCQDALEHAQAIGFEQGFNAATQALQTEAYNQQQELLSLFNSIPEALAFSRFSQKAEIADIVLRVVQAFFVEKATDLSLLQQAIERVLEEIHHHSDICIALHPSDLAALVKQDFGIPHSLTLKEDASLRLGGCLITCTHGVFDLSIERQIEQLKSLLIKIREDNAIENLA